MTAVTTIIQSKKLPVKLFNTFPSIKRRVYTRQMSDCIFCKIVAGDVQAEIYFQDDEIVIFKDIKPAAKFHSLAVPKRHIANVNNLGKDDINLLNKLVTVSKEVLAQKGANVDDMRLGFHLPPFNSISHLHVHVISPVSEMTMLHKLIFKPNTWWFATVDAILEKLQHSKL